MWLSSIPTEEAVVAGSDPLVTLQVAIAELAPSQTVEAGGQTNQSVSLLLPSRERLVPPVRLLVRGDELRVLGTQIPAFPSAPAVVTCERVNPDLSDAVLIVAPGQKVLDDETGRFIETEEQLWSGMAHISSGTPATVEAAGEGAPLDKVTITLPLDAPAREGLRVRPVSSRTPGVMGGDFGISGEVLDSSASLRKVVGYRLGV